jgi:Family of unknown function (DUF5684)
MDYSYNYEAGSSIDPAVGAAFGAVMLFWMLLWIAIYVYFAIVLMKIAKKTNTPNGWFAWIPFLNLYLIAKLAGKSGWWLILMLIPFVNIIIAIIVWMAISKRLGHPEWLGILIIIPIANLIVPGYLAFAETPAVSDGGDKPQQPPSQPTPPPAPKPEPPRPEKKESTYDKSDTIDMD